MMQKRHLRHPFLFGRIELTKQMSSEIAKIDAILDEYASDATTTFAGTATNLIYSIRLRASQLEIVSQQVAQLNIQEVMVKYVT